MSNRRDGAIALRSAEAGLEKTGPLESVHFRAEYGGRLVALSGTAGLDGGSQFCTQMAPRRGVEPLLST